MSRVIVASGVRVALLALAALAGSCATQGEANPNLQSLDRPTDVAFTCYGRLRANNGAPAELAQAISFSGQPLGSCRIRANFAPGGHACKDPPDPNDPPCTPSAPSGQCCDTFGNHCGEPRVEDLCAPDVLPGQQSLVSQPSFDDAHAWYAFILQSVPGTVAVAEADVKKPDESYLPAEIGVQDATPLTPGKNSLSVGSMPIAIAGDASGCYMVTANAGSCDLSIIDSNRAITRATEPAVRRQPITTASGVPVLARPAAMLAAQEDEPIGRVCPADPTSLYYIAYPDCHAIAAVRAATGKVEASIRFADDGTASLGDGELQCPKECDGEAISEGARPVAMDITNDVQNGSVRLAIGLDNRPVVTVVDLDSGWLPVTVSQVELSGDVAVTDIAISPQIGVGGQNTIDDQGAGTTPAQFVYAVTTDGSVRVAEVFGSNIECDTQADPRFLLDAADAGAFVCIPVDQPGSPPRRAGADGPGIRIQGEGVPVSVSIVRAGQDRAQLPQVSPGNMFGTFAYVGLSSGLVAVVNIDDDNYDDLQLTAADPFLTQLPLAMPHQPRDVLPGRLRNVQTCHLQNMPGMACTQGDANCVCVGGHVRGTRAETSPTDGSEPKPLCLSNPIPDDAGGPHAADPPQQLVRASQVAAVKAGSLPFLRQVDCQGSDGRSPVSEVTINAPDQVRLATFPDWEGAKLDEIWSMTWEGPLSGDTSDTAIDGPSLRSGYVEIAGGGIRIHDAARPFCQVGVEDRDTVVLRGCDPTRGNAGCGPGQTCYVHPDSTQATGACLPTAQLPDLVAPCRDFLISQRRFAVKRAFADTLELIERRRSLRTTPITGCTSTAQCQMLATYEDSLKSTLDPKDDSTPADARSFSCEVDPSRPPINGQQLPRCVQTCAASSDCGSGGKCSGGYCIDAPVPPPQCVVGLQRFEIDASDAFVVLGTVSGYLHPMVEDTATGRCVKRPDASPLLTGRIPLTAPPCASDAVDAVAPNPCTITVQQADAVPTFRAGTCTQTGSEVMVRDTTAVRFRNPAMTLNMVDTTYPGDATCNGDRGGSLAGVSTVYQGYQVRFHQVAGFAPMAIANVRASYLSNLVVGPDRGIWAVDEGDVATTNVNARGGVYRITYDQACTTNCSTLGGVQLIR